MCGVELAKCSGALVGSTLGRSGLHYGEKLHDRAIVALICRSETHCSLTGLQNSHACFRVGLSRERPRLGDLIHRYD